VNSSWLFWHIIDVLRSEAYRQPERDVYCPAWATLFGWWFLGALTGLILEAFPW
jgi:hypothetical protein